MIRYTIDKSSLHELLEKIGLLRPGERLAFVDNLSLLDRSEDRITVAVERSPELGVKPIEEMTENELKEHFVRIASLEIVLHQEKSRLSESMVALMAEMERRSVERPTEAEYIPDDVEEHIREQLRHLLDPEATGPASHDDIP